MNWIKFPEWSERLEILEMALYDEAEVNELNLPSINFV